MRTKESQNTMIYSTESLWGEAKPHTSDTKEPYHLSDERNDATFRPFIKLESGVASSWTPFLSNFSTGSRNSSVAKESNTNLKFGSEEFSKTNSVFQTDFKSFNDKRVVDYDTFDSIDHQKGITEHAGSDLESVSNQMGGFTSADRSIHENLPVQSQQRISFVQDPQEFHGSVDSVQKDESKSGSVSDVSENDSFLVKKLPFQEHGTQRLFRSFLTSFDDEATKVAPLSEQIPPRISVSELSTTITAPTGLANDEQQDSSPDQSPSKKSTLPADTAFKSYNDLVTNQGKYDVGESSFSEARLITYSKPIPHPGSVSMRSDGSISGRSFAFPILQSEWNSSPVKMAKADRRNFRKNRGWRTGIFCCKF